MLSEDDILTIIAAARASRDDAAALLQSQEAIVEAARAALARSEGALQMAQHVLDEHRVAQRRSIEAAAAVAQARASAPQIDLAVVEASRSTSAEEPAFIQR